MDSKIRKDYVKKDTNLPGSCQFHAAKRSASSTRAFANEKLSRPRPVVQIIWSPLPVAALRRPNVSIMSVVGLIRFKYDIERDLLFMSP
jgi:hypothetical protein